MSRPSRESSGRLTIRHLNRANARQSCRKEAREGVGGENAEIGREAKGRGRTVAVKQEDLAAIQLVN